MTGTSSGRFLITNHLAIPRRADGTTSQITLGTSTFSPSVGYHVQNSGLGGRYRPCDPKAPNPRLALAISPR